jgi:hypothetical protein
MTTTHEKMKQVLRDSGHFTEDQIKTLFSDAFLGCQIRQDNEDDEQDGRIESIEKIINLYDSIPQTDDMDWDDRIAEFSSQFGEMVEEGGLDGIVENEINTLDYGLTNPRLVMNYVESLRHELKLARV